MEKQIRQRLAKFPIPKREQEIYCLDQRINDRGIMVDRNLVNHAVACDLLYKETATARAYELTGLENPNSVSQLKLWLKEKGLEVDSLAKDTVKDLSMKAEGDVQEVLKLRLATSKTSVKKYEAIDRSVCAENRVHGLLQFYGANRQADGQGGWCRFIIFRRIICRIWNWRERWYQKEDMKKWNFSMKALQMYCRN